MTAEQDRRPPSDRDEQNPAATRAENETRPTLSLSLLIAVLVLVVGTVLLTYEVRKRRAVQSSAPTARTPEALGLPSIEVAMELQSVANRIQAAWRRDGGPPEDLSGLPPDDQDPPSTPNSPALRDPPVDLWGRPYLLRRSEKDGGPLLTLITQGSDGAPGGVGDEQDVLMEIVGPEDD